MSNSTSTTKRSPWWKRFAEDYNSYSTPDPWLRRKFVVIITLGISVWALYVAIGRVCVPAIQQRPGAAFSRGAGIGLLIPCLVLWLMFFWSYLMMIYIGPGFAKEVVSEAPDPGWQSFAAQAPSQHPENQLSLSPPPPAHLLPEGHHLPAVITGGVVSGHDTSHPLTFSGRGPNATAMYPTSQSAPPRQSLHSTTPAPNISPPSAPITIGKTSRIPRPTPGVSTAPRWCQYCKIIKPDRTHHCRHCGTCVQQFDHHCIWIGQCVGWRNHAIFVTFCFWAGVICLFNTIILIVDTRLAFEVDGQKVALITISAILFMFTLLMMLPTHVYLILTGKSTIESFQTSDQLRAEDAALKLEFNNPACPTREVRAVRKEWTAEYGGVAVNDRWAVGRKRDRWRQEMGADWVGWVLPIGRPLGDGIHYAQNPRFGPNGEWLPVREWPKEVARL